jgi:MscS family membrane protein
MYSELADNATQTQTSTALADMIRGWLSTDSFLLATDLLIENWQWIGLLTLLGIAVVLERITTAVFRKMAKDLTRSSGVSQDYTRLGKFVRPFGILVTWWIFLAIYPVLDVNNKTLSGIIDLGGGLIVAFAGIVATWRFVDVFCDFLKARAALSENKFDDMLVPLLRRTLKIFVIVIGVAYFSSRVTEDFYKVIAGLSIGSAVLLFAFKDSLENVFGTFTVLMDQPFQLGDWITVGSVDGTVERVGFRSTRVRTFYNSVITVPNRDFISATVDNWGARRYRRIKQTLGLTYDTPPEKVEAFCEGIRELIRQHPYTRKDYFHVYFTGFGASSLDVLVYCFVEVKDWSMELREKHRLFADILRLAEQLGVQFAFPTTSLHVVKPEDLEHPNRPATAQAGAAMGKELGLKIARATMDPYGEDLPGPVVFQQPKSPSIAPGGGSEGGDGDG